MYVNQDRFLCQVTLAIQYDILTPEGSNAPRFKVNHYIYIIFILPVEANDRIYVSLNLRL